MNEESKDSTQFREHLLGKIRSLSQEMPPQQDIDGNKVISFEEWISNLNQKVWELLKEDEKFLQILKTTYHSQIYNIPRPSPEPVKSMLEKLSGKLESLKERLQKFLNKEIPDLQLMNGDTYMGSDGEVYSETLMKREISKTEQAINALSQLI